MKCSAKHTKFQPPEDALYECPQCGSLEFRFAKSASGSEGCPLLHEDDYVECCDCNYEATGQEFSVYLKHKNRMSLGMPQEEYDKMQPAQREVLWKMEASSRHNILMSAKYNLFKEVQDCSERLSKAVRVYREAGASGLGLSTIGMVEKSLRIMKRVLEYMLEAHRQ